MDALYLIGGSGFIGKNLVKHLHEYYDIYVYDKYIDKIYFNQYPDVFTFEMDLVTNRIKDDVPSPKYIINLASIVTAERNLSLFNELISANLKILLNLYERFKGESQLKLFIQFGSSEEYGSIGSPFKEESREYPNSPYALIKQLTTNTCLMLERNYDFPATVIRPGNLFGFGQNKSKFIPYVIEQLVNNVPLNVSPCEQKRDFIYVDDFVLKLRSLLENYSKCIGEIINVSSGYSISLKEIIELYKKELGSTSKINYGAIPYRENEVMDLKCNIEKLNQILAESKLKNRLLDYLKI
ncbi:MAG: NAD-dependent epimerase/dehydratase family protein [Bacteroides sp.]|jgi:nucleoside-diphosphate-sugar epimerase|nr:NAD-dependent epimerase/dehydratase family protein [Bacteroides sp.]MCI1682750.1 NAD-dependent epimerase/dehydratase family protein [Bacteroides sp.]